jgi:hypothetical protein
MNPSKQENLDSSISYFPEKGNLVVTATPLLSSTLRLKYSEGRPKYKSDGFILKQKIQTEPQSATISQESEPTKNGKRLPYPKFIRKRSFSNPIEMPWFRELREEVDLKSLSLVHEKGKGKSPLRRKPSMKKLVSSRSLKSSESKEEVVQTAENHISVTSTYLPKTEPELIKIPHNDQLHQILDLATPRSLHLSSSEDFASMEQKKSWSKLFDVIVKGRPSTSKDKGCEKIDVAEVIQMMHFNLDTSFLWEEQNRVLPIIW